MKYFGIYLVFVAVLVAASCWFLRDDRPVIQKYGSMGTTGEGDIGTYALAKGSLPANHPFKEYKWPNTAPSLHGEYEEDGDVYYATEVEPGKWQWVWHHFEHQNAPYRNISR